MTCIRITYITYVMYSTCSISYVLTRLAYSENGSIINVGPGGTCCDASGDWHPEYADLYLASHVAIQGTSKPVKYTLLYEQIGIKIAELQLLTYWTTYLYSRCNRSVSIATPAYYAPGQLTVQRT
jgi:eukaryotic translation initiation factor 2C